MARNPKHRDEPETTGHEWDGIQEYNNPLPRWWLWVFYATIIWGIGYTIFYPAWPGIRSATSGVLEWSTRASVAEAIEQAKEANAGIDAQLASADLNTLKDDPKLNNYAISAGASVFRTWCAQCHGEGAAGSRGYPNLLDNDWLWGGTMEDIHTTVSHGIRNEQDPDARFSQMPAFGDILSKDEIRQVVNFVMSMSETPQDPALVEAGSKVFADNCASCHGDNGQGDQAQGAPNLADGIWLYGGDYDTLIQTVTKARYGVMPAWSGRLTDAQVNAVTAYVHQLGGGQ